MKYSQLSIASRWRADNQLNQALIPEVLRALMIDKGSLTAALTVMGSDTFRVNVLGERIALPDWHEQRKLQQPLSMAALIREVELMIHNQAVVYARSIIPLTLISNNASGLSRLGQKPLGHLLFKDGRIRVSKREFACVELNETVIHARRTPYDYMGSRILVSEFFLPTIIKYLVS